jgi:hypothetical protein
VDAVQVALEGEFPDDLFWVISWYLRHFITDVVLYRFVLF